MNFTNFGIGVGALADGIAKGIELGRTIKAAKREKAIQDETDLAIADAKAAQQADINTGGETKPFMDYYMKTSAPRIRDAYLQNGDVQTARVWSDWIKNDQVQKGMSQWAKAVQSAQRGDSEGFLKGMVAAYNTDGYFDDGTKATGSQVVKDKDGNITGYEITFKGPDGKESKQTFENQNDLYQAGMIFMSPEKVFEYGMGQLKAAQEAKADLAKEDRKYQRDLAMERVRQGGRLELEGVQQNNALDRQTHGSNLRIQEKETERSMGIGSDPVAKANAMAQALKSNGWTDEQIRQEYPRLLGVYRQSQSDRDRLSSTVDMLSKSDLAFAKKTPQDQVKAAQALLDAQDEILRQNQPSAGSQTPAPQSRGLPMWGPNGQYYIPQ